MKNIIVFMICISLYGGYKLSATPLTFTDPALKTKLLSASSLNTIAKDINNNFVAIDLNNDGEIDDQTEALLIKSLNVSNGNISDLGGIEQFTQLQELFAGYNNLTNIMLTNLNNLTWGNFSHNQIVFAAFSNGIQVLDLSHNNFSGSWNFNYPALGSLDISYNAITSLTLNDNPSLVTLIASYNQINSVTLPDANSNIITNSTTYQLDHNQLGTLDASGVTIPIGLYLNDNNLTTLYINNNSHNHNLVSSFLHITNNPNLTLICVDAMEANDILTIVNQLGMNNVYVGSFCSATNPNSIRGKLRYDSGNNGCTGNAVDASSIQLVCTDGATIINQYTNHTGEYQFTLPNGNYTVTPTFSNSNYITTPISSSISLLNGAHIVSDFCLSTQTISHDLEVTIQPIVPARPGFLAQYQLVVTNKGSSTQSGDVTFTYDHTKLGALTSTPSHSIVSSNQVSWSFTNLAPFQSFTVLVESTVSPPPTVNIGEILPFCSTINTPQTDVTPNDNSFCLNQIVVGAYDPNDIACIEGPNILISEVGNDVNYLIRFENTGTYPAQNVVVKTSIDLSKFDISTFTPTGGSALYTTSVTNGNEIAFNFQNIQLGYTAGSNTGYVSFKIKTLPSLVVGNSFGCQASIYFDFNPPIITNDYQTIIRNPMSVTANADGYGFGCGQHTVGLEIRILDGNPPYTFFLDGQAIYPGSTGTGMNGEEEFTAFPIDPINNYFPNGATYEITVQDSHNPPQIATYTSQNDAVQLATSQSLVSSPIQPIHPTSYLNNNGKLIINDPGYDASPYVFGTDPFGYPTNWYLLQKDNITFTTETLLNPNTANNYYDNLSYGTYYLRQHGMADVVLGCCFPHPITFGPPPNTFSGKIDIDINGDGCNSSDPGITIPLKMDDGNSTIFAYSNSNGNFSTPLNDGNYLVTPIVNSSLFSVSPTNFTTGMLTNSANGIQDFCLTPIGSVHDVKATILTYQPPRPGFPISYFLTVENLGNLSESGTASLIFNPAKMSIDPSTAGALISSNTIQASYTNLLPGQHQTFQIKFNMHLLPNVLLGETLTIQAVVNNNLPEVTLANNSNIVHQTVVGAYDPNDINCAEGLEISSCQIGEYLHYTIRFENTGNYSAQDVVLVNDIDLNMFDINTLIPLFGSHNYTAHIINGNQLEVKFQNINLGITPTTNKGYFTYKIKSLPTLLLGTSVSNQAKIYFDYNPPIITNLVNSQFVNTTSQSVTSCGSYTWPTNGQSYSTSGTYTTTVIDASNCQHQEVLNLSVAGCGSTSAHLDIPVNGVICPGQNAQLRVIITGGVSPYTVIINDGYNNITQSNYLSGAPIFDIPDRSTTYSLVSVIDANGAVGIGNTGNPSIIVNPKPEIVDIQTSPYCQGIPIVLHGVGMSSSLWTFNGSQVAFNTAFSHSSEIYTVAGGNGSGSALNQLNNPYDVFVTANGDIYVSDHGNHRIQKWDANVTPITTVAGGNGPGNAPNQLDLPNEIFIDPAGTLYISDGNNHRVQQWLNNSNSGITIAGGNGIGANSNQLNGPSSLFIHGAEIYISDVYNNRIQKWPLSAGTPSTLWSGFNLPHGLYVTSNGDIYVCDRDNHQVLKRSASSGIITVVAGGNGSGSATNQLNSPTDVCVDATGFIYVSDRYNHRVIKFPPNSTSATHGMVVAGGNGAGSAMNQLNDPLGIFLDANANLYVTDHQNNRIQKYVQLQSSSFTPTQAGTYTVIVSNVNGCTTTQSMTINPLPTVSANNVIGSAGSFISLSGIPIGGTYSVPNPYNNPLPGVYPYTYTYTDPLTGCTNSASAQITVTDPTQVSVCLTSTQDAMLHEIFPNTNYGSGINQSASRWTYNGTWASTRSLFEFDLSNIPTCATITSATLTLRVCPTCPASSYSDLHYDLSNLNGNAGILEQVTSAWSENGVTWNTAPTISTANAVAIPSLGNQSNANIVSNVTALVQQMLGSNNFGFQIRLADNSNYFHNLNFATRENPDLNLRPELCITYTTSNYFVGLPDDVCNCSSTAMSTCTTTPGYYFGTGVTNLGNNQATFNPCNIGSTSTVHFSIPGNDIALSKTIDLKSHGMFIKSDGSLWGWGVNNYGQTGTNTTATQWVPVLVDNTHQWKQVSNGANHTVAIDVNGDMFACGGNDYGQVGDGTTFYRYILVPIGTSETWKFVSCGWGYSVAITTNGKAFAWGRNSQYQCGIVPAVDILQPTLINPSTDWADVSCGAAHTLLLKNDHSLYACGYGIEGQLGSAAPAIYQTPTLVNADQDWKQIQAGETSSHAIKMNNQYYAWGGNAYGQLGNGNTNNVFTPTPIGNANWQNIHCNVYSVVGVQTDGSMYTWGYNTNGQLSHNSTSNILSPQAIGGNDWAFGIGGADACLFVKQNGQVFVSGRNAGGELGLGQGVPDQLSYQLLNLSTGAYSAAQNFSQTVNIHPCTPTVNVKLLIEGYYASASSMHPVLQNQGVGSNPLICDDVMIELHHSTSPYALVGSSNAILNTDGTIVANFTGILPGAYYVAVKHRNAIETWSSSPVNINTTGNYDFSNLQSRAYGSNQTQIAPGLFALYSGDINQDGVIDGLDYNDWETDSNNFAGGYFSTDLNGDGVVDGLDFIYWEQNSNNFVGAVAP
jgi:sugar lactone lactonase YvrE